MTNDPILTALGAIELVGRVGGTDPLAECLVLLGEPCEHSAALLFTAGLVCDIAQETGFDLAARIASSRADALAPDDSGGMA